MKGRVSFPYLRIWWEYMSGIMRTPLSPVDRGLCLLYLVPWLGKVAPRILTDFAIAADVLFAPLLKWKPAESGGMRKKTIG